MKTIWKFSFPITDLYSHEMPKGAEILTIQMQNGNACMWAIVDPNAETEIRRFAIQGTGNPFSLLDYKYIGTFQMMNGNLVWHLFEVQ